MIKAEDLRIGDLVIVNKIGCMVPKGTMCKVVAIDSEKSFEEMNLKGCATLIELEVNYCNISFGIWCKYISPIPLTPELLEKNEWKRDKLVSYIYGHEAHNIEVICTPNSEWVDVTFKGETIHRIKYVHELQHILWALGLDAELKV